MPSTVRSLGLFPLPFDRRHLLEHFKPRDKVRIWHDKEPKKYAVGRNSRGKGKAFLGVGTSTRGHTPSISPTEMDIRVAVLFAFVAMNLYGRVKKWAARSSAPGIEFVIQDCSSVQGCRLALYEEAEKHGARRVTPESNPISSHDNGLLVKLAFENQGMRGFFLNSVRRWCSFNKVDLGDIVYNEHTNLGRFVFMGDYVEEETDSPPDSRARKRSRESAESLTSFVTEILDPKSELCVYQSVEAQGYSQKDGCHLLAHCECKGTPMDSDPSNRLACSTQLHRALDGTSKRHPPWARVKVKGVDINPVLCEGVGVKQHNRYRVDLYIDFMSEEHRRNHGFYWKDGSRDDGESPVETFVYVKDYDVFTNCVEWKYKHTTAIWAAL
ncbi:unknown [Feldmannia species virus]|uniref:Uncharacterized protein n=1 Tax=Feldmannia species virus TaxID=39420 RepID=B5LWM7_9PHYC|nr:hypothetical protein FeldSpV_gp138 [Feldmannia species virus]ACH46890.1 unknown [Feldmannia species virus]